MSLLSDKDFDLSEPLAYLDQNRINSAGPRAMSKIVPDVSFSDTIAMGIGIVRQYLRLI